MKNKLRPFLFLSLIFVTSCVKVDGKLFFNPFAFSSCSTIDVDIDPDKKANYYIPESMKYTYRDINEEMYGWHTSKTLGEQKILVIPVQLKDGPSWTQNMLSNINIAFFGKSEDTNWESVSSFYKKSSYGKLNFSGEVASTFKSTYTTRSLSKYGEKSADYIITEYCKNADQGLLKQYDLDNDGFVDNAVFIYSNNYTSSTGSSFWAWSSFHEKEASNYETRVNNYMWASYYFSMQTYKDKYNNDKVDAHTYIHEMGHLLGLDDFYDCDSNWNPCGENEMQSYNIGDHNIYAKLSLGWVDPYVITGEGSIELNNSSEYPEAILINNNWNKSRFDEYLLIEYYAPKGLNETDSLHNFGTRNKMYSDYGLRIYHIDARLVKIAYDKNGNRKAVSFVDEMSDEFSEFIGASNTTSNSLFVSPYSGKYKYVHLLDQGGNNAISGSNSYINNNSALWDGSKTFIPTSTFFANGTNKFNSGDNIDYTISVSSLNEKNCTVTISSYS